MDRCLREYADLEHELRTHLATLEKLSMPLSAGPASASQVQSRRLVLSSLQPEMRGQKMFQGLSGKAAALLAALGLMSVGTLGAAAAGGGLNGHGPLNDVLSSVGVVERASSTATDESEDSDVKNHGSDVSQKVHDAIASTTPGPGRGIAVSQAACEAAHDRSTLPTPAQNAPGQKERTPKPDLCVHPNADGTPGRGHGSEEPLVTGTPVPSATSSASQQSTGQPSSPGKSGEEHGKPDFAPNNGNAASGTPSAGPGQSSTAPGRSDQAPNAGGPPQSPPGRPANLPNGGSSNGPNGGGSSSNNPGRGRR